MIEEFSHRYLYIYIVAMHGKLNSLDADDVDFDATEATLVSS